MLNGAGVESMLGKWDEMFGQKKQVVVEEVKVQKPRKKVNLKKVKNTATTKKPIVKKSSTKKTVLK